MIVSVRQDSFFVASQHKERGPENIDWKSHLLAALGGTGARLAVNDRDLMTYYRNIKPQFRTIKTFKRQRRQGRLIKPATFRHRHKNIGHTELARLILYSNSNIRPVRRHLLPGQTKKLCQYHGKDIVSFRKPGIRCFDNDWHTRHKHHAMRLIRRNASVTRSVMDIVLESWK